MNTKSTFLKTIKSRKMLHFILRGLLLLLFPTVSCTSDFINDSFFSSEEEAFTVDKARKYFETFATTLNLPNITEENGDGDYSASESRAINKEKEKIVTPAWGRGVEKRKKNTQVVEVPLETDYALYSKVHTIDNEKDTISSAWYYSQSRLMICKKGVDNYSMFQITIVPVAASNSETEQMLEDFEYSGRKGMFSGYVFCSTLDGQCYRIFKYENGEIVKLLNKTVPTLSETVRATTCETEELTTADTLAQNIKPKYKFSFSYQALSRFTLIIWERDENGELVGHIGEVIVNPPDDYEEGDELPIG